MICFLSASELRLKKKAASCFALSFPCDIIERESSCGAWGIVLQEKIKRLVTVKRVEIISFLEIFLIFILLVSEE